jgi:FkbM family methyltransferase
MTIIMLAGLYRDHDENRRDELRECLRRNLQNELIDEIHLFAEEPIAESSLHECLHGNDGRIQLVQHGRRLEFADLFAYANLLPSGCTVLIANADIFFDHTLSRLEKYDLRGKVLCLSRWDVQPNGSAVFFDHPASQDAWIFQTPVPKFSCAFHLGVPGCDNRLAFEAAQAGLTISNPSRSIRAQHLHLSGVRRYVEEQRYVGPTSSLPAGFLETPVQAERIYALTSLSLSPERVSLTRDCLNSWRQAGLEIRAFNHPSELSQLANLYDVDLVPVTRTTEAVFGGRFVPIDAMLEWAAKENVPALLINSDIELRLAPWEIKRARWLADGGLCYFVRYNHDGDLSLATREINGIDAFLFHGRDAVLFPRSDLSMGQPFWDYWIPHVFAAENRPIRAIEFPAAFHRNHQSRWSWENWHRCALEFIRITGEPAGDGSFAACHELSERVRRQIEVGKVSLSPGPFAIREWVQNEFDDSEPKTFLELGSHQGADTEWLAKCANVKIHVFEPDPRNNQPARKNVIVNRAAIAERDGAGSLIMSTQGWGQEWTYSSSIKSPKRHLERFPVTFGEALPVVQLTLDTYCRQQQLEFIDLIWATIQGAEGEMVRGARRILLQTNYIYTDYSDDELYDGQASLSELLEMLPHFRVVELWPDHVLLENTSLAARSSVAEPPATGWREWSSVNG